MKCPEMYKVIQQNIRRPIVDNVQLGTAKRICVGR